mgnify:CR=1 FL=1
MNFGPYLPLAVGYYEASLEVESDSNGHVATVAIADVKESQLLVEYAITGALGRSIYVGCRFALKNWVAHPIEVKTYWNGRSELSTGELKMRLRTFWEGFSDPLSKPACAQRDVVKP